MNIIFGRPPNFQQIVAAFPSAKREGCIFTYGDTVFVTKPNDIYLIPSLKAHEQVHIDQQKKLSPERWWENYLKDDTFRLEQELPAHRAEYACVKNLSQDRNKHAAALSVIAQRLSGSLYNGMLSYTEARRRIVA